MEDNAHEYEKEEILKNYFNLLNPYKGGTFLLVKLKNKRSSIPLDSPPLQRSLNAISQVSPPHSPRKTESIPIPKLPIRTTSLDSRRGSISSSDLSTNKDLSNRSSTTLQSLTSPRTSSSIGKALGRSVPLPVRNDRTRSSSMIDSPKIDRNSVELIEKHEVDPIDEGGEPTEFKPNKPPTLTQRLKFNLVSQIDDRKARNSKSRKDSFIGREGSVRGSRANTPLQSINSSPVLSPKKASIEDFDFWNELIEGSGFFLGMQPRKLNHPFLVENSEYLTNSSVKPFILNPSVFSNTKNQEDSVLGCVFTFQESFELSGGYLNKNKVFTHTDFQEYGILSRWLPITDDTGEVNVILAQYRLLDMMDFYLRGLPIYLNCKSGKGRSAMFAILFFAFCFLLDKRVGFDKAYLNLYMTEKDLVIDSAQYNELWQLKRTRLCKIVERISRSSSGIKLVQEISPDELPNDELLKELFSTYEDVVKSDRKIKLSTAQRSTGLMILKALSECLYSQNIRKSHYSAKIPNDAFIDDLTQTNVIKDIHIHMDGIDKEDICCKSFQEFLIRLAHNIEGWYEELVHAVEGTRFVEGECGYFTKTASDDDRVIRKQLLIQFKKEIDVLIEKYPSSEYARVKLGRNIEGFESPKANVVSDPKISISPTKSSPRTFSGAQSSPRVRSFTLSKDTLKQTLGESHEEGVTRARTRTFGKVSQPSSPTSTSPRLDSFESGPGTSPKSLGISGIKIVGFSSPRNFMPVANVGNNSSSSYETDTDEEEESSSVSP